MTYRWHNQSPNQHQTLAHDTNSPLLGANAFSQSHLKWIHLGQDSALLINDQAWFFDDFLHNIH